MDCEIVFVFFLFFFVFIFSFLKFVPYFFFKTGGDESMENRRVTTWMCGGVWLDASPRRRVGVPHTLGSNRLLPLDEQVLLVVVAFHLAQLLLFELRQVLGLLEPGNVPVSSI